MMRFRPSPRVVLVGVLLVATSPALASHVELTVEPRVGVLGQNFTFTITNRGTVDFLYDDCCSLPEITSPAYEERLPICIQCAPCPPEPALRGVLPPGGSLQHVWPSACAREASPTPGIYEVRWGGFPPGISDRFELRASPERAIPLAADPPQARLGEPIELTLENTSGSTLRYELCPLPPRVLNPNGFPDFFCEVCPLCPACFITHAPGEVRSYLWSAGDNGCQAVPLPGRYRIIWPAFETGVAGRRAYFGEAGLLLLPPLDRRVELSLSKSEVQPGDVLTVTATNPLETSIWMGGCCNPPLLIDELGNSSPCMGCLVDEDCAPVREEELPPGGSISVEVTIPAEPECRFRPGRWSVIWGFGGLTPGSEPALPVLGYAEVTAVPSGGGPRFRRGDCDGRGGLDITDPIFILAHLFLGGDPPACPDACDSDDSGLLDVTDAVRLLAFLFLGGLPPEPPFPEPGPDPTTDGLPCG